MPGYLKQSTASQSRAIGPFVDDTDFKTAETALTIANTDIKLIVNGAASANKNSGGGTHRANGVYGITFDATDTATVGEMQVSVVVAGALPVFDKFFVLEEAVYDALFGASAPGYLQPTTAGRTLDVSAGGEAGIDWANIGSPTTTVNLSATTIKTATDVETDTADIQTRLPAALVSGRMDASVGAMAANVLTATAIAADAIGASELASDAVAEIADAVWDEILSGHLGVGSTGEALNAAGAAGDPWTTALPGAYGAGSAGKIIGDNINATISSRASQTSLDTLDDFVDTEVAAIKAKTDLIPAAPAAVGDIPTAVQNADALLGRNVSGGSSSGRTVKQAFHFIRNRWVVAAGTLSVYDTDDTTSSWTAAVTGTAGADPVTGSDPA